MKKLVLLAFCALILTSCGAKKDEKQSENTKSNTETTSATQAPTATSSIVGKWKWTNSDKDYPVYYEFKDNGDMLLHKMKPDNADIDRFKWSEKDDIIFYFRPGADEQTVNKMKISQNDGKTLILQVDESSIWLEKM